MQQFGPFSGLHQSFRSQTDHFLCHILTRQAQDGVYCIRRAFSRLSLRVADLVFIYICVTAVVIYSVISIYTILSYIVFNFFPV
jgi:hypothetical protein